MYVAQPWLERSSELLKGKRCCGRLLLQQRWCAPRPLREALVEDATWAMGRADGAHKAAPSIQCHMTRRALQSTSQRIQIKSDTRPRPLRALHQRPSLIKADRCDDFSRRM